MYQNALKLSDAPGTVIGFFKNSKQFIIGFVLELLKLAMMLIALQFEIDNFIDYTNGEALLFEPVFIVEMLLCFLVIIRLMIMSWKSYKISYRLIVIEDAFPVKVMS